jgi:cyclomaltodextrinase / maltogenic alpha-amylase / neopullulanase
VAPRVHRAHRLLPFALAVAVLTAACTGGNGKGPASTDAGSSGGAAPPPTASPTASENPVVGFDLEGGDAFAWMEQVSGAAKCSGLTLSVNGDDAVVEVPTNGSSFRANVPLRPGRNEVVARCTGQNGATEESAPLVWNERLEARPTAHVAVSVSGQMVTLDGSASEPTVPDGSKVVRYRWTPQPAHPVTKPGLEPGVRRGLRLASGRAFRKARGPKLRLEAPTGDGEYYVSLTVADSRGRFDTSTIYFVVRGGQARAVDMVREHPAWIDSAVIYAPIPALWGTGPRAVTRRLPYLKKLGVDALWLWPPSELRTPGEEYAIDDYFKLDTDWKPGSDFRALVQRAHALGMHVLIDIVPNHMSSESPYFQDTREHGTASHYYAFFDRDAQGKPTHYFDWTNLPNLNYDNPEVRAMIVGAFTHWVRDLGVDGFRVDAAWGVERRAPGFWPQLRHALKRVDPDLLLIAEGSAVDPYFFSHGFDVGYDWTDHPGQWAWTSVFEFPQESGALLRPAVTNEPQGYAPNAIVMRFLNNNDTGIRFVDQYGPELTRVAAVLQFTLPGVPEMFAGDEIGASYEPYSTLAPIAWRDRFNLKAFYKRLIFLKHHLASLSSGEVDVLALSADGGFAYIRPAVEGSSPALVLLNFGDKTRMGITRTSALDAVVGDGTMTDLLTHKTVRLSVKSKSVSLQMDTESAFVLVPGAR